MECLWCTSWVRMENIWLKWGRLHIISWIFARVVSQSAKANSTISAKPSFHRTHLNWFYFHGEFACEHFCISFWCYGLIETIKVESHCAGCIAGFIVPKYFLFLQGNEKRYKELRGPISFIDSIGFLSFSLKLYFIRTIFYLLVLKNAMLFNPISIYLQRRNNHRWCLRRRKNRKEHATSKWKDG